MYLWENDSLESVLIEQVDVAREILEEEAADVHLAGREDLCQDRDHVTLVHIQGQYGIDPIRQELGILLGVCGQCRRKTKL